MAELVFNRVKGYFFVAGVALLAVSVALFLLMLTGIVNLPPEILPGESTIHTVARIPIVGCLLAAIGSLK